MLKSCVAFFACRTTEQVLKLEDPNSLEDDMGVIVLNLNLIVKQGDFKRHVSVNLSG